MAHPINDAINKQSGKTPVPCTAKCKYWKFPHLDRACVLSDVYSVAKGELCYEFNRKVKGE